jgi:hypothetical protein
LIFGQNLPFKATTDYQTIENFLPLEEISNLFGQKYLPESQNLKMAASEEKDKVHNLQANASRNGRSPKLSGMTHEG